MSPVIPLLSQFYLKFGGTQASENLMRDVRGVEIDSNLHLPDMCTIQVHDAGFRWVEDELFRIGQDIEIESRAAEDEQRAALKVFAGQITAIEGVYLEEDVPTLVIRAYDRSHILHRGTNVRAFRQSTDSDIASRIARERGLQAEVDSTSQVHVQLFQDNQSDYEFLLERARAVGHVFYVEDRKLYFKKPGNVSRPAVELDFGSSLLDFRPRVTVASQVKEVSVRGWDPATKRELVGQATSTDFQPARTGWNGRGAAIAERAFGASDAGKLVVTSQPIASQAEGELLARSLLSEFWANDVSAEGRAIGNPRMRPGTKVNITGMGQRFGGEYYVTWARHVFDADGHFLTHFGVKGYDAGTLLEILSPRPESGDRGSRTKTRGLAIGIVTDNKDPENLGRVKVKYPWLADDAESDWARLAAPMAGKERGFFYLPEINDEVAVAFEHGDLDRPFILGALWNGEDVPPLRASEAVGSDGAVNKRVIKTRAGHMIMLDDTRGAEKIEVVDKTGNNRIVIDSATNKLMIGMAGDIEVDTDTNIKLTGINITIEGRSKVELKAPQVEVAASGRAKISGATLELN